MTVDVKSTRVPAGGLYEGVSWLYSTRAFGSRDHGQSRPVLDGPSWVVTFQLQQDGVVLAQVSAQPLHSHERGLSHQILDCRVVRLCGHDVSLHRAQDWSIRNTRWARTDR